MFIVINTKSPRNATLLHTQDFTDTTRRELQSLLEMTKLIPATSVASKSDQRGTDCLS